MGGQSDTPFSARGLAPQVSTDQIPPEMLQGIMSVLTTIAAGLDSVAQAVPDKGAQVGLIKELLQRLMAEITQAGAGPLSPTAPGPAFPGGGLDRGISGPGSI
jgi:hypothetical protein